MIMGDEVAVKLHAFLTSTLDESANLSTARCPRLKGDEVGPRSVTYLTLKRKLSNISAENGTLVF
jgi:hypothetical protein